MGSITTSTQQAAHAQDDASDSKKGQLEELSLRKQLRRRSVEYLLQGAGAVIGGVQDETIAAALSGRQINLLKISKEGMVGRPRTAGDREMFIDLPIRETLAGAAGERGEGGGKGVMMGRIRIFLTAPYFQRAHHYKAAKGFKHGPGAQPVMWRGSTKTQCAP